MACSCLIQVNTWNAPKWTTSYQKIQLFLNPLHERITHSTAKDRNGFEWKKTKQKLTKRKQNRNNKSTWQAQISTKLNPILIHTTRLPKFKADFRAQRHSCDDEPDCGKMPHLATSKIISPRIEKEFRKSTSASGHARSPHITHSFTCKTIPRSFHHFHQVKCLLIKVNKKLVMLYWRVHFRLLGPVGCSRISPVLLTFEWYSK